MSSGDTDRSIAAGLSSMEVNVHRAMLVPNDKHVDIERTQIVRFINIVGAKTTIDLNSARYRGGQEIYNALA